MSEELAYFTNRRGTGGGGRRTQTLLVIVRQFDRTHPSVAAGHYSPVLYRTRWSCKVCAN